MAGPLVLIDTINAKISLDINRTLRLGPTAKMKFKVPDTMQADNWRVVKTLKTGFDRISGDELIRGDARTVFYQIADTENIMADILREENLHVEVLNETFSVEKAESPAPNEAQVYTLTCKIRTIRTTYFNK